jgi:hypothetical protein
LYGRRRENSSKTNLTQGRQWSTRYGTGTSMIIRAYIDSWNFDRDTNISVLELVITYLIKIYDDDRKDVNTLAFPIINEGAT